MVSPWHKYKSASKRKKAALHSLIAGLGFFSLVYAVTRLWGVTLCPIRRIFGRECIGCGLSRGFVFILSLDFAEATKCNVLSIPLFIGCVLYAILCVSDILLDKNNLERIERFLGKKYMLAVYLIIFILVAWLNLMN